MEEFYLSPLTSSSLRASNFLLRDGKHARVARIVDISHDLLVLYVCAAPAEHVRDIDDVIDGRCAREHLSVMVFSKEVGAMLESSEERVWSSVHAMCLHSGDFVQLDTSGGCDNCNQNNLKVTI